MSIPVLTALKTRSPMSKNVSGTMIMKRAMASPYSLICPAHSMWVS